MHEKVVEPIVASEALPVLGYLFTALPRELIDGWLLFRSAPAMIGKLDDVSHTDLHATSAPLKFSISGMVWKRDVTHIDKLWRELMVSFIFFTMVTSRVADHAGLPHHVVDSVVRVAEDPTVYLLGSKDQVAV